MYYFRVTNATVFLIFVVILIQFHYPSITVDGKSLSEHPTNNNTKIDNINTTLLDCRMRILALEYAKKIQPWLKTYQINQITDALELKSRRCIDDVGDGEVIPNYDGTASSRTTRKTSVNGNQTRDDSLSVDGKTLPSFCLKKQQKCIFVAVDNAFLKTRQRQRNDYSQQQHQQLPSQSGSIEHPFDNLHDAIFESRRIRYYEDNHGDNYGLNNSKQQRRKHHRHIIIMRQGVHTLHRTIHLTEQDKGLVIRSYPGENVSISGGILLNEDNHVHWKTLKQEDKPLIFVANLTKVLLLHHMKFKEEEASSSLSLPSVPALFSSNSRYIRARYPNSNPEIDQWGYASPNNLNYSLPLGDNLVIEWHRPPPGAIPKFAYVDFSSLNYTNNYSIPLKNDSTMPGYNLFASGHGGVCSDLWGIHANSYWCSNASSGGWAEVDQECATTGILQIPVRLDYNISHPIGRHISGWRHNINTKNGKRKTFIYAWHSQSWSMHMFEVQESYANGTFTFTKGSGKQGGRNWCRCDQCTYAGGGYCRQKTQNPPDNTDQRLISGTWLVEHVLEELDVPGEFYFDYASNLLYIYPNATGTTATSNEKATEKKMNYPLSPQGDFRFAMLETLISMKNTSNIMIQDIRFRDTVPTFMSEWSAPSGGDWALHRGGAIFVEEVENITIKKCIFSRLDGNAIFLSGMTRNVKIQRNTFEWIGESAIATWGNTDSFNATSRDQPMMTFVEENFFHELGIFQKQSSAWGQAKAALNTIRNNIMFNLPRAAINFNDMMGGGDTVMHNLIFNSCRESGDHGPINSWDRQPYLTTLKYGDKASFEPIVRSIAYNFIIANYGASQAIDNDDGSSFYHIHHNVFYDSDGFKMDYGGHDSIFEDNIVIGYPSKVQCYGFGDFFKGHGHVVRRNRCVVPVGDGLELGSVSSCDAETVTLVNNSYYSPNVSALFRCGNMGGDLVQLNDMQKKFGLEIGSTSSSIPSVKLIVHWIRDTLLLWDSNKKKKPQNTNPKRVTS